MSPRCYLHTELLSISLWVTLLIELTLEGHQPSSRCNARQGPVTRKQRVKRNSWVCRRCEVFNKRSVRWCETETEWSTSKELIKIWRESHWQQPHCRGQNLALCPCYETRKNKETVFIVEGPLHHNDRVGAVTYRIQLIESPKTLVVHRNRLKLCYSEPQEKASKKQPTPAPPKERKCNHLP